jgi:hypothetical protein
VPVRTQPAAEGRRPGHDARARAPGGGPAKPAPLKAAIEAPKRVERLMIGGDARLKR